MPPYSVPSSIACSIVSSITIYEVGSNVGIPDPQYFNKQFRKVTGISPSRYRDDNQEYLSNIPNELSTKEGRWQES
ncbi:MAG: AraC family transcriptional regulator [Opitutae bacterium]|nr:AraC family transcriptional regulator [Opitutae bacterium]